MFTKRFSIAATLLACVLSGTMAAAQAQVISFPQDKKIFEVVGQFNNSGTSSVQYGYLSNLRGLATIFTGEPQNESTALFTFVTNATTNRVISNGPFLIVNRTGTTTFYLNTPPSTFSDPASFGQGTPIQVSSYQQQVILNTQTGSFNTIHFNLVTSAPVFSLNGKLYRFGTVGTAFRTLYSGQVNGGTPPPSGWFSGYALGIQP